MRRWRHAPLLLVLAGATAQALPVQYVIQGQGTQPGVGTVTRTFSYQGQPCPACAPQLGSALAGCQAESNLVCWNFQGSGCGAATYCGGVVDGAQVKAGYASVTWALGLPSTSVVGGWLFLGSASQGCNWAAPLSGSASATVTAGSTIRFGATGLLRAYGGDCSSCLPNAGRVSCFDPVAYSYVVTIQYQGQMNTMPYTCPPQTDTKDVPANGQWNLVTTATCVAPNQDTTWTCTVSTTVSGAQVECRMVADPANPEGPNGKHLLVRVKTVCPICPPTASAGTQKQGGEAPWALKKLDCSSPIYLILPCPAPTFAMAGCLMTCLANVTGKTPDATNNELGEIVDKGGGLSSLHNAAKKLGYVGATSITLSPDAVMTNGLCKGHAVFAHVQSPKSTPSGHWVAITGQALNAQTQACDDYTISDPGYSKSKLSEYASMGLSVLGVFKLVKPGGGS